MKRLTSLVLLALAASCGYPRVWVEETEQLTATADGIARLRCHSPNGSIDTRVVAGGNVIRVTAEKRGGGADDFDAEDALAAIEVQCETDGDELVVGWRWPDGDKPYRRWGGMVSFDIVLPAPLAASISTHNGGVTLSGVRGDCDVSTHNGNVRVSGELTALEATTHNGGIRAAGALNRLDLETHNGNVTAELEARGRVDGRIRTHNGSVTVALPDTASTEVRVSTHNGAVSSGRSLDNVFAGRGFMIGTVGDGEGRLELRTHNGSVRVR